MASTPFNRGIAEGVDELINYQNRSARKTAQTPEGSADGQEVSPQNPEQESGMDRFERKANIGLMIGGMGIPAGLWATKKVGNGIGYMGAWAGLNPVKKVAKIIKKPSQWWDTPINELGIPKTIREPLGAATQQVVNSAATVTGAVTQRTGLSGLAQRWHTGRAARNFEVATATASAGNFSDLVQQVPESLRPHFETLDNAIKSKTLSGIDPNALGNAIEAVGSSDLGLGRTEFRTLNKVTNRLGKAVDHHGNAQAWKNPAQGIKALPGAISKQKLGHVVTNTAFVGMSALAIFGVARGFAQNLTSLKQMCADIEGKNVKDISTRHVLFGKVSEPVSTARSIMVKRFGIQGLAETVILALTIKAARNKKVGMLAFMAPSMAAQGLESLMAESVLPVYKAASEAHQQGQKIPAEFYAAFIKSASADLRARREDDPFIAEIAAKLAERNVSPKEIMQQIAAGKFPKNYISEITAANEAAKLQAPAEQSISHTASLTQGRQANRTVVGPHTLDLKNQVALDAGPALGGR